ncbi:hypothetical protein LBMAG42_52210 [Deltaproteobacteria bacterium]|nr:hypothetical protein LBMAG42_52210 [Deltaproteobacteria bacterium]
MSQRSAFFFAALGALLIASPAYAGKKGGGGDGSGKHEGKGGGKKGKGKGQGKEAAGEESESGEEEEADTTPKKPTVNGMYISPTAVAAGLPVPDGISTSWAVGTPVYLSAVFPQTLDVMAQSSTGAAVVHLNVYDANEEYHNTADLTLEWTVDAATAGKSKAIVYELWPADLAKAGDPKNTAKLGEWLIARGSGSHDYYVDIVMVDPTEGTCSQNPIPFGTFTFTAPSDMTAFTKAVATVKSAYIATERMDKAAKTDSTLQSQMMKAYTESGWPEKPLRAVILDKDWDYYHDNWGNITSRRIHGEVAVDDGAGNCRVFIGVFDEEAAGGGKYTLPVMQTTDDFDIACANVMK